MREAQKEALEVIIGKIKSGELFIGEKGRIYKYNRSGKVITAERLNNWGYYQVRLYKGNKNEYYMALSHRVIYAFYYGIESLQSDMTIHHVNYDKTNNEITNLVQISSEDNSLLGNGKYKEEKEQLASIKVSTTSNYTLKCRLGKLITERGYYKTAVAKALGMKVKNFRNYDEGICYIPMDKAHRIADFLGVAVDDLYEKIQKAE